MRHGTAIVEQGTGHRGDRWRVLVYGEGPAPYRQVGWHLHALYWNPDTARHERDRLNALRDAGRPTVDPRPVYPNNGRDS